MCPPSYRRPRVMTQCNFSRWREKTVRRAGGEADEGRVTGSRFSPCFPALALNWRGSHAVFSRQREKMKTVRLPCRKPVSGFIAVGIIYFLPMEKRSLT